ncbi:unnamed protein product [Pleuronectes platessa]|uniref:Uncharacterized protein n=1 Tax=Pleuronectes platessa TaxID=8262 RepID=A0A9N7UUB6_PLEPL|nr:unnamed protein product [Pleuronectes platessa]
MDGQVGSHRDRRARSFQSRRGHLFRVVSGDQCRPVEHVTGEMSGLPRTTVNTGELGWSDRRRRGPPRNREGTGESREAVEGKENNLGHNTYNPEFVISQTKDKNFKKVSAGETFLARSVRFQFITSSSPRSCRLPIRVWRGERSDREG